MKHIILLEDNPRKLKKFIMDTNNQRSEELDVEEVLYYNAQLDQESDEVKQLCSDLNVEVTVVNLWNFFDTLNELYEQEDTLFIFDTDLNENLEENVFSYRINVNYAMRKGENAKIWFYTGAGPDFEKNIEQAFPNHVIPVDMDENQQLDLKWRQCRSFQSAVAQIGGV